MTLFSDTTSVRITPFTREHADHLLMLIDALADYENLARPDDAAKERLIADGLGDRRRFEAFLAWVDDAPAGYAITFQTYSSFLAKPTQYLEDIFILPEYRKRKAGLALFLHVAGLARERGCGRMEWTVLDWNTPAQQFYDALGAEHLRDWYLYRLTEDQLAALPH
jgi:GNAT superfamily N-acetyltransferase